MSPRRIDPRTRPALIEIGARLLADEGPRSLSTRRIAAEAGTSTMAVYTYFGGMSGLVREMVHEGFARLQRHLSQVAETDDPVADMALLGRAYRHNALANPHLYAVMFGGSSLAGFELSEEDRQHGRYNLSGVVDCARRCIAARRFRRSDEVLLAHQMWITIHGLGDLELGSYLIDPWDAETCLEAQLVGLMVGAGRRAWPGRPLCRAVGGAVQQGDFLDSADAGRGDTFQKAVLRWATSISPVTRTTIVLLASAGVAIGRHAGCLIGTVAGAGAGLLAAVLLAVAVGFQPA